MPIPYVILGLLKRFWPVAAIVVLVGVLLIVTQCGHDDTAEQQVQQTNRSGEAAANAAEMAIDTLETRMITEHELDMAVQQAAEEIGDAQSVDAIRDIVLDSVCGQPSHRADPACRVQPVNP